VEWLDKFHTSRGVVGTGTKGWAQYLWDVMNEERVEAVLQRAVMKESKEVAAAKQVLFYEATPYNLNNFACSCYCQTPY
jgi:hypothetical protein